jgi:predicted NBD/HSP70 family sugar kinase
MENLKNHSLIKRINRSKILNTIRQNPMVARSQIADRTELDKKSITNFVTELMADGLVEEAGRREGASGRPFTMLRFCEKYVVGIYIGPHFTRGVLLDLYGTIVSSYEEEYPSLPSRETVLKTLENVYTRLTFGNNAVYGVGICLPGIIDLDGELVIESVNLPSLNGMDYRQAFGDAIRHPFFVEEESAAIALGEKWFGVGRHYDDFICVELSGGIGSGIIYQRRLFKGAGKYAGELGHVVVHPNGKPCRCGNRGCLEAYASETAILPELNQFLDKPLSRLAYYEPGTLPDAELARIRDHLADEVGRGLAAVVNILCPRVIILTGTIPDIFGEELIGPIKESVENACLKGCFEHTNIYISRLELLDALGAATLPLADIFEVPDYFYV